MDELASVCKGNRGHFSFQDNKTLTVQK